MRIQVLAVAAAMVFGLALPALAHDGVAVLDPYARTTGGAGSNGAVFMVLDNHANGDDRLVSAASDVAAKVELHTHVMSAEGMMQMLPVEGGFALPPLGQRALQRGGDHIMLIGLARDLQDGDTFTLTLTFEAGGEVVVEVPVNNARMDAGGGHGAHDHGAADHGAPDHAVPDHGATKGGSAGLAPADIQVQQAFALVASEKATTAALFMDIVNAGAADDVLIAVETAAADRATLHTHALSADGMMQMLPVDGGFAVAAGTTRALARGGDHLMLTGLSQPLADGARLTITLTFEQAGKVVVVVPVQGAGGTGHAGHGAAAPADE